MNFLLVRFKVQNCVVVIFLSLYGCSAIIEVGYIVDGLLILYNDCNVMKIIAKRKTIGVN